MKVFHKNPDEPISTSKEDRFGRREFAKALAKALIKVPDAQSLTVGLYGAWGSGKTSIIRMAEEYLRDRHEHDVIIICFNPWIFSSAESLHVALFGTLARGLGEKLDKGIAIDLRKYAQLTGTAGTVIAPFFPPAPILARIITSGMAALSGNKPPVSADSLKLRVDKMLKDSKKRVVVIIDDIDRLDSDEIHTVFKLVKNVAHFSNISYLLAFDQNVVAKALAGRYPEEQGIGGNFVEKIVQLPLYVPTVDQALLSKYLLETIESIIAKHKMNVPEDDAARFQAMYFSQHAENLFTTPRKVVRYLNSVDFAFERLANEASFTDILLVDILRVFFPDLYATIASHKELLLGKGIYGEKSEASKEAAIKVIFGDERPRGLPVAIVRELFPNFEWAFGGATYSGEFLTKWEEEQRVCADKHFGRYFTYGIPIGDIADGKVDDFIALLSAVKTTQATANKALKTIANSSDPALFISKLRLREDKLPATVCEKLAPALVSVGSQLPRPRQSLTGDMFSAYVQSALLAVKLTRYVQNTYAMLEGLIKEVPLNYAAELLRWIRVNTENDKNEEDFDPLITLGQLANTGKILAERIESYAAAHYIQEDFPEDTPHLMWIWQNWGDKSDISDYFVRSLQSKPKRAVDFLDTYVGHAYEIGSGKQSRAEFRREAYDEIAKTVDPAVFVEPLERLFGKEVNSSDEDGFPGRGSKASDKSFEYQVAKQFLYIHRHVLAKTEKEKLDAEPNGKTISAEVVAKP